MALILEFTMSLNLVKMPMVCPLDGVNVTYVIAVSVPIQRITSNTLKYKRKKTFFHAITVQLI
jgi:hypothetical protein